jgi:phosphoenolpyruvate-protein kinase (PTS system EI component)
MVAGAAPIERTTDLASSRYVDFPGIGVVDLNTAELPSNDRKMLEVATKLMFADPSVLDTIMSVVSRCAKTRVPVTQHPLPRWRR